MKFNSNCLSDLTSKRWLKTASVVVFSLFAYLFTVMYAHEVIPAISIQFSVIAGIILITVAVFLAKVTDDAVAMIFALALIGILYFVICPFEMPPDEPAHFRRAFEISAGGIFSKPLSSGAFGDILPRALNDCWNRAAVIDWNDKAEVGFTNTALYSFVNYLPQALGILLARIFTNKVAVIYYIGRLFNFLFAFALSAFALKKIPFGRKILFVIMLFPMTLQEMISMSPDALVNALSFAFVAFILDCAYQKEKVGRKDIALIGIMLCAIALCKIVYLGAVFLIYIIPSKKMTKRDRYLLRIAVPLVAVSLNLISLAFSTTMLANVKYGHMGEIDSNNQMKFILSHPSSYAKIFVKTLISHCQGYIETCVGSSLGWLNIDTPFISWGFFVIMLAGVASACNDLPVFVQKRDAAFFALTFLSGLVLILTSEYVGWTALRAKTIEGVQGRYFIPILPCLLLPLGYKNRFENNEFGNKNPCKTRTTYLIIIALILNFIALVHICKFYPDISKSEKVVATLSSDASEINVTFLRMKKYDELQVAVWSDPNGQDDLHWFSIAGQKNQKFEDSIPLELYETNGRYIIHVYGTKNGKQSFLAQTELHIQFPERTDDIDSVFENTEDLGYVLE